MKIQSDGLPLSVLRGNGDSFLDNGMKKMILHRLLFSESLRCDGNEGQPRTRPDAPQRGIAAGAGGDLLFRSIRDQAQIHVAVRPGLAARVGAEEQDAAQRQRAVHRLEALAQGFAVRFERGRQVFKQQLHESSVTSLKLAGKRRARRNLLRMEHG